RRRELEHWMEERPRAATRQELVAKFGKYAAGRAISAGALTRVLPGVYSASQHAQEPAARTHAAVLWAPRDSVLGGATALALHAGTALPAVVDLVVPHHARAVTPPWLRVRWRWPLITVEGAFGPMLERGFAVVDAWHR